MTIDINLESGQITERIVQFCPTEPSGHGCSWFLWHRLQHLAHPVSKLRYGRIAYRRCRGWLIFRGHLTAGEDSMHQSPVFHRSRGPIFQHHFQVKTALRFFS